MKYIKDIDIRYSVDVLVVGGGPAGVSAAWACAKNGSRVLLVENTSCLGGMGTIGGVPMFTCFTNGIHFLSGGFGRSLFDRCFKENAVAPNDYEDHKRKNGSISIQAEKLKKIYDEMVLESGAEVLFYTKVIDAACENGHLEYVVCSGRSSIFAVKANVYIDCTGDGVLACYCGAEYEKGDSDGKMQPGTLCTVWTDIDWDKAKACGTYGLWPSQEKNLEQAYRDGVFSTYDKHLPGIWRIGETTGGGNIGHAVGVDGTDEVSLTKASLQERQRIWEYETYYRNYVEGFENSSIIRSGEVMGIRESRRIKGRYTLTAKDYFDRADFEDEIGRYSYEIDIHSSNVTEADKNLSLMHNSRYQPGESYGIPYRCLTPLGFDNLLVAGRCISCDRYVQASVRVMPGCFITGQGAGIAAHLASRDGGSVTDVDVKELRKKLREIGAYLKD